MCRIHYVYAPLLPSIIFFFFFNDTATTEIYTLSLHDALPISRHRDVPVLLRDLHALRHLLLQGAERPRDRDAARVDRDGHAAGDLDWPFSDSTHVVTR